MKTSRIATVAVLVAAAFVSAPSGARAEEALSAQPLASADEATALAQLLAGSGVNVSNVVYTGAAAAAGSFSGGAASVGFDSGIVLSSGAVTSVAGPNAADGITGQNDAAGDADLDALLSDTGFTTQDASVLEFDFVPNGSQIAFAYVFASDEYNEYVNTAYDDVFGFYVNGTNCALVPGTSQPVSINTINNGNPYGSDGSNAHLYRNNDLEDGGGSIPTEMDGLTTVLSCTASVKAGQVNRMKLAIADTSDAQLDSAVFLRADSLTTAKPCTITYTGATTGDSDAPVALAARLTDAGTAAALAGRTVQFGVSGPSGEVVVAATTDAAGVATASTLLRPGDHTVTSSFPGDQAHSGCGATSLLVIRRPTSLAAQPVLLSAVPGATVHAPRLTARLTDVIAGTAVGGKRIDFSVAGRPVCSAFTDAGGSATCSGTVPTTLDAVLRGGYTATFAGGPAHMPTTGTGKLLRVGDTTI